MPLNDSCYYGEGNAKRKVTPEQALDRRVRSLEAASTETADLGSMFTVRTAFTRRAFNIHPEMKTARSVTRTAER